MREILFRGKRVSDGEWVRYKERRASYSEGMDAKRHLAALKAYQEGN